MKEKKTTQNGVNISTLCRLSYLHLFGEPCCYFDLLYVCYAHNKSEQPQNSNEKFDDNFDQLIYIRRAYEARNDTILKKKKLAFLSSGGIDGDDGDGRIDKSERQSCHF